MVLLTMYIDDPNELLALHRCLLEAKFNPSPDDTDILGSPVAAELANKVMAELEAIDGAQWSEWRKVENHPQRVAALVKALGQRPIKDLSVKDRVAFIRDALAPLIASEAFVNYLVNQVFESGST